MRGVPLRCPGSVPGAGDPGTDRLRGHGPGPLLASAPYEERVRPGVPEQQEHDDRQAAGDDRVGEPAMSGEGECGHDGCPDAQDHERAHEEPGPAPALPQPERHHGGQHAEAELHPAVHS